MCFYKLGRHFVAALLYLACHLEHKIVKYKLKKYSYSRIIYEVKLWL